MWWEVFQSFLWIAGELFVLFIAISFLINLLQVYIPYEKLEKYMSGRNTPLAAALAIVLAFITPFCSCSTIPVIVNMLSRKMRFGIVMVFLFASPVLDPTIITLMAVILGVKVAAVYTVITTVLSIIIGFTLERFGFESAVKNVILKSQLEEMPTKFDLKYATKETIALMKSVFPYLLIGAAIGSVIHGLVPTSFITTWFGGDNWWLVPVAAIVGIPLYIRLSTMIPISQIMIAKGMALGPVMALMISSAGASLPELTLLNSIFQKRLVVAFVISVFSMSTLSGFLFYLI